MAASSSTDNKIKEKTTQYYLYPPQIAQYEDVIGSPKLFMDTLGKFHAAMGTKFKIPIVGGKDLDLHRLFVEVTSRGGIKRVLEEKKWREVTNCFNFPPSATNASFILRKYYMSLIHHFEQVYYFKAKAWTPVPTDTWQSTKTTLTSTSEMNKSVLQSPEIQVTSVKRQRTITEEESLFKDSAESSIGLPVTGIIDGKFDSGYLCTVRIGGEQLQGVLYQTTQTSSYEIPKHEGGLVPQGSTVVRRRRRRRKKSEMRKRDPAHPKPNRSGYNFFFAEQHARLKLLHTGKDRGISRMIGEEWNKLTESEKAVYQEKAVKDKERYRSEMEQYKEGFKRGEFVNNAMPLQQQYYTVDTNMMLVDNIENNGGNSHQTPENDQNSEYYDDDNSSSFEGEEKTNLETGAENVNIEKVEGEKDNSILNRNEDILLGEHKKLLNLEDDPSSMFLDGSVQQKSISVQDNESKQDGKISSDEQMIPEINDEMKIKSPENQEKVFTKFDEKVENRPLVTSEEKDFENPVPNN